MLVILLIIDKFICFFSDRIIFRGKSKLTIAPPRLRLGLSQVSNQSITELRLIDTECLIIWVLFESISKSDTPSRKVVIGSCVHSPGAHSNCYLSILTE